MKKSEKTKTMIITGIIAVLLLIIGLTTRDFDYAKKTYQVYLNGNKLGLIESKDELYALINEEQKAIKETYNVENVYPPNGFVIREYNTYDENVTSAKNIYDIIKDQEDFTVKGYTIKIKFEESEEEQKEDITLYVLDENVFKDSLKNVVTAFIDKDEFNAYINNTQEPIDEVGEIIEDISFEETITIKPSYISVNEKIYTDATELTQYLLFGAGNSKKNYYTIKQGDTIFSVSEANQLNPQEFLIANPKYKNEESILAIGDKVDVTLIDPMLTLVESIYSIADEEQEIEKEVEYDASKPYSFSEVTQTGISKIERVTRRNKVINGEPSQGVETLNTMTIREAQKEITVKGGIRPSGSYFDNGRKWGWPTNRPYQITSGFQWRWGKFHNAIDISGTGEGSPIYAARAGVVTVTETSCANHGSYRNTCGGTYGNHVIINHGDRYYTMYAHLLQNVAVNPGDTVKRGQVIGYMGSSGSSTGVHLHFGISYGEPNQGGSWKNPFDFYR